jgi:hypothetical protein
LLIETPMKGCLQQDGMNSKIWRDWELETSLCVKYRIPRPIWMSKLFVLVQDVVEWSLLWFKKFMENLLMLFMTDVCRLFMVCIMLL